MKKRIYAGITKVGVLTVLATALMAAPVYAANGDLWKGTTNIGSVGYVLISSPSTFLDLVINSTNYSYEVDGKGYNILAANDLFNANPKASISYVQALIKSKLTGTPLASEDFSVISID